MKQQDISQHGESVEAKIHLSGENKNEKGKSPMKVVCPVMCQCVSDTFSYCCWNAC